MVTSALDQLIAQSKQITEDLMAVRREAKRTISARCLKDARQRAENRLYLVLTSLHALTDDVRDAWEKAADLDEAKPQWMNAVRAALDDGQLKLVSGDFD